MDSLGNQPALLRPDSSKEVARPSGELRPFPYRGARLHANARSCSARDQEPATTSELTPRLSPASAHLPATRTSVGATLPRVRHANPSVAAPLPVPRRIWVSPMQPRKAKKKPPKHRSSRFGGFFTTIVLHRVGPVTNGHRGDCRFGLVLLGCCGGGPHRVRPVANGAYCAGTCCRSSRDNPGSRNRERQCARHGH